MIADEVAIGVMNHKTTAARYPGRGSGRGRYGRVRWPAGPRAGHAHAHPECRGVYRPLRPDSSPMRTVSAPRRRPVRLANASPRYRAKKSL